MKRLMVLTLLGFFCLGCDALVREEAEYQGVPTSGWVDRMKHDDVEVRREAAAALGELGTTEVHQTLPVLIEALKDSDRHVKLNALGSLDKLGAKARKARTAVAKAINDPDKIVANKAIAVYRRLELSQPSSLNQGKQTAPQR
jgi:hypothetical protein